MSSCISKDLNIQRNALKFLFKKHNNEESTVSSEAVGGFLSKLNYAWLINNSRFLVISCKNGSRVGSWDFGNTLQDNTSEILRVDEIQRSHGKEPLLVISINCVSSGGIICIFDFLGSKVIRAIQIVEQISTVHVIDGGLDIFNLSGPLRNFDGVLAVGTVGGNVYIIDICRQFCYEGFGTLEVRDELNPCEMQVVTFQDLLDIENHKKNALRNKSHLAIHLNVVLDNNTEHFVLKAPGGVDKVHVNKEEVLISALHYCPQLGSILVGYNFGAYQIWNLMTMELIYTSPICEDHVPISKFAIQEPADDPRAFCYIWAVYSSDDDESILLPYLVMYALCYESKEFHEGYGILYENFQYCAVRFHMELGFNNNQSVVNPKGSKCLRMQSVAFKNSLFNTTTAENIEDMLSLCIVIWKINCEDPQFTYMAVFDLNQWYKAQMPNSPNSEDCSSYMITICITDLIDSIQETADVFDVIINRKTLQQFIGTQRLEEHYYPSSLSFDTCCLLENKIVTIQYQGIQKSLLYQMQSTGPICLIRPTETYQEIVSLGLMPLFVEIASSTDINLNFQREVILNVALEQQLTSWLCKCATEWANGSFSSAGCSLDLLTSWALQRATVLKHNCDNLCVSLFDYSEVKLDTNTTNILNNCIRQIKNISFFYSFIVKNLSTFLNNGDQVTEQCNILQMVEKYFEVLQWLFNVGLLPEYATSNNADNVLDERIRAPYPVDELTEYYRIRRSELLISSNTNFSLDSSLLFIDNLINIECGGDSLINDWKRDGGDGFYPPRSLQALLRTYLMDGIEVSNKHSVVIYLFLDLAMILDPTKYNSVITHLIKFPAVFKVSPSLIKITQAFWQLDHGDFSSAMEQLLDPMVNQEDLKNWHHKIAIKSLLIQEQYNSALLYMNIKKTPILDDEDLLCTLSLLVSNNMLDEAFYLEKHYKNYFNSKKFIKHLFAECSKYGRLDSILYRNLTDEEEAIFLQYLDEVKHPHALDLKITYFMQRSHYMEAFKTYQSCGEDPIKKGLDSRLNLKARDEIVHAYKKLLPTVSFKFIESCTLEPNPGLWKEVTRPEPMSVSVYKADEKPEYKSSLIYAALAKAKQTFRSNLTNVPTLTNAATEEIPFLRTPTLPPLRKRSSVQVIVPKIVDEDGPSPEKKRRYSNRFSQLSQSDLHDNTSILMTPIVRRREMSRISPLERRVIDLTSTPTSILKNTSILTVRKPIARLSNVRFDVPSTSSSEELTSSLVHRSPREREARTSDSAASISFINSSKSISRSSTPKNMSNSDDQFYSPNSSLNNIEELPKDEEIVAESKFAKVIKLVDYDPSSSSSSKDDTHSGMKNSLKGRRSYKKQTNEYASVRSSPRLNKTSNLISSEPYSDSTASSKIAEHVDSSSFSPKQNNGKSLLASVITPSKLSPRKSLHTQALENNTFFASASVPESVLTMRTSSFCSEKKDVSVIIDEKHSELSYRKTEYSDVYTTDLSTPEKFSGQHSIKKTSTVVKETGMDSEDSLSRQSSAEVLENSLLNPSDSLVEALTEDLRQRQLRESRALYNKEDEDSSKLLRNRPSRISRRSARLSAERTLPLPAETTNYDNNEAQTANFESDVEISRSSADVENSKNESRTNIAARKSISRTSVESPPRRSRRLSAERTLTPTDESKSSNKDVEKVELLKIPSKPKSRKSLSRQVLESNAIARLTSQYQCMEEEEHSEMAFDEKEQSVDLVEGVDSHIADGNVSEGRISADVNLEFIANDHMDKEMMVLDTDDTEEEQSVKKLSPESEKDKEPMDIQEKQEIYPMEEPCSASAKIASPIDLKSNDVINEEKREENVDLSIVYADLSDDEKDSINELEISDDMGLNEAFIGTPVAIKVIKDSSIEEESPSVFDKNIIDPDEVAVSGEEIKSNKTEDEIIEIRDSSSDDTRSKSTYTSSKSSSESSTSNSTPSNSSNESFNELNKNIFLLECYEDQEEMHKSEMSDIESQSDDKKSDESSRDGEIASLLIMNRNNEPLESEVPDQQLVIPNLPISEDNTSCFNADEYKVDEMNVCSIIYDGLSEESSNPQDPKMNVFEISDDLKLNECVVAAEEPFIEGDMVPDLCGDIRQPTPPEFEENIMDTNLISSDEIVLQVEETNRELSQHPNLELTKQDVSELVMVTSMPKLTPEENTIAPHTGRPDVQEDAEIITESNVNKDVHSELVNSDLEQKEEKRSVGVETELSVPIETMVVETSTMTDPSTSSKITTVDCSTATVSEKTGENKTSDMDASDAAVDDQDKTTKSSDKYKNKTYDASSRRKTRKTKSSEVSDIQGTVGLDEENTDNEEVPSRKRGFKTRLSMDPASPSKVNITLKLPEIDSKMSTKPVRTYSRKRTKSVDTPYSVSSDMDVSEATASTSGSLKLQPRAKRTLRSASVECESSFESTDKIPFLFDDPADQQISDVRKSKRKPDRVTKRSMLETYTMARRMTRRQANILESALQKVEEGDEHTDTLTTPSVVSEPSSVASSSSVMSKSSEVHKDSPVVVIAQRRLLRSASVDEQIERKKTRRSKRTISESGSVSSEASSTISTRSKRSTSSKKSEESSTKGRKRKVVTKSNLSKIKEEVSSESSTSRRGKRNPQE